MRVDDLPTEIWPKAGHLLEPLRGVELPRPAGYFVLAVQWQRPEKTRGGIILSSKSTDEDKYQGRTGVVIGVGDDAYGGERFRKPWCKVGDWIAWPAMENAACRMEYAGAVVTALPDDRVVLVGVDPLLVS